MKQKFILSLALVGLIALGSCEDSNDPTISDAERIQHVLDRLEKNEGISYQMFDILKKRLTSDSLKELRKTSKSKDVFINLVARQTDDYFLEVVEGGIAGFDIATVPTPFQGEAEITLKALASNEPVGAAPFDVVGAYSKMLLEQIEKQAADGHKDWIVVQSMSVPGKTPGSKPVESLSLNFTKVEWLASVPHTIIMDLNLTDDQVLESIDDVLNKNNIPPIAAALLLPAIQKVRENTSSNQPFEDAMNAWLEGPVTQTSDHGLDRDLIRRIQATVYLAALHTILLDEYEGANEDVASLSVLHARYRAAVIMGTDVMWTK